MEGQPSGFRTRDESRGHGVHQFHPGAVQLLGKQFTLSRGDVEFSGATPPDPLLNVLVTYAAANITAEAP